MRKTILAMSVAVAFILMAPASHGTDISLVPNNNNNVIKASVIKIRLSSKNATVRIAYKEIGGFFKASEDFELSSPKLISLYQESMPDQEQREYKVILQDNSLWVRSASAQEITIQIQNAEEKENSEEDPLKKTITVDQSGIKIFAGNAQYEVYDSTTRQGANFKNKITEETTLIQSNQALRIYLYPAEDSALNH